MKYVYIYDFKILLLQSVKTLVIRLKIAIKSISFLASFLSRIPITHK